MNEIKRILENGVRTKLRLSEIERIIRKHRIIVPPPSRQSLLRLCEDGTFETVGQKPTPLGWLVYEESFWDWVSAMDGERPAER